MLPQSKPRKVKNSSKVNLMISFAFHAVLVLVLFYFAAREGLLGKKLKKIAVQMVKEKPPEKPKSPEPQKSNRRRPSRRKLKRPKLSKRQKCKRRLSSHRRWLRRRTARCRRLNSAAARPSRPSSDPVQLYKGYMEYVLRQKWNRPDDEADDDFAAEVAVSVDRQGNIENSTWLKGSGDDRWDATVKQVFNVVKTLTARRPRIFRRA